MAVLVSGEGTNLQAIIDSIDSGYLRETEIDCVVSDRENIGAIERARRRSIPVIIVNRSNMLSILSPIFQKVDLVVLAGFLKILPSELVKLKPVINIHPSLLPLFGGKGMYGLKVHEEVIRSGMKVSGCTIHLVTEDVDGGPIIAQKCVTVESTDNPESLQQKIHPLEHQLLVETIKNFGEKKFVINNKKLIFI